MGVWIAGESNKPENSHDSLMAVVPDGHHARLQLANSSSHMNYDWLCDRLRLLMLVSCEGMLLERGCGAKDGIGSGCREPNRTGIGPDSRSARTDVVHASASKLPKTHYWQCCMEAMQRRCCQVTEKMLPVLD